MLAPQQDDPASGGWMDAARHDPGFLARHVTVRRPVALLLAVLLVAGCVSWQPGLAGAYAITSLVDQYPDEVRAIVRRFAPELAAVCGERPRGPEDGGRKAG